MKRFSTLLLIAVAAFAGYTHWQLVQLQRDIRGGAAAQSESRSKVTIKETDEVANLVAQAKLHGRRAQTHLDRGQTRKAKQEMELCIQKLGKASELSQDKNASGELVQSWQDIKRQVDKLWKDFAQQKPQKGT